MLGATFCAKYGLPERIGTQNVLGDYPMARIHRNGTDEQAREWRLNRVQIDTGCSIHLGRDGGTKATRCLLLVF